MGWVPEVPTRRTLKTEGFVWRVIGVEVGVGVGLLYIWQWEFID